MKSKWDPSHKNIAKIMRQIRDGHHFGSYIANPFTDAQLVQIIEKIILDTRLFKSKWKDWRAQPVALCTWPGFIAFGTEHYHLWKKTEMAASSYGYGGNI